MQYRRLRMELNENKTLIQAADKAGISAKTARKYIRAGLSPTEMQKQHGWRTRPDPFEAVWDEIKEFLELDSQVEAKSVMEYLIRKYPDRYCYEQLRTLQRKFRQWRALEGPAKEVFFEQVHEPGRLGESDFTEMSSLGITIRKEYFRHMLFHYVLTYSNWETGNICFSESFESLSEGLQAAWWELGGVPARHRTDNLSAAVHKECNPEVFTDRYSALLRHYGVEGEKIRPAEAHENGDVEQRHFRIKKAVRQALIIRGSNDFDSVEEYQGFLKETFQRQNAVRMQKFREEAAKLRRLPTKRLDDCREVRSRVSDGSTIVLDRNVYSVDSRLIGEWVDVRLYADHIEVRYADRKVEEMPRLKGREKHRINYKHIIDWLVRKPGAFERYRYRDDLYPTTRFRRYYDQLRKEDPLFASKRYLEALLLASQEGEQKVDQVLGGMLARASGAKLEALTVAFESRFKENTVQDVRIDAVDLSEYDRLLENAGSLMETRS
jgi:hypothetical protein